MHYIPSNRVLSVVLKPSEDVNWIWTTTADGSRYVSGYKIVKRKRRSAKRTSVLCTSDA
jgi:hypothetical protein